MLRGTARLQSMTLMVVALLWLVSESTTWACPNCRDALAGDASHAGLVQGLFWSIILLLSMPFLILAGLSSYFYYLVRSARLAAAASAVQSGDSPFSSPDPVAEESAEVVEV
jgi:hypothetical protein